MAYCDDCKYYKIQYAPYIRQRIATCSLKGGNCSKNLKEYYKKKKEGEKCLTKT